MAAHVNRHQDNKGARKPVEAHYVPPVAALTAPGICHHLPIDGQPSAGDATLLNGCPSILLHLGFLETGQPVDLECTSLAQLSQMAYAVQVAQSRLANFGGVA